MDLKRFKERRGRPELTVPRGPTLHTSWRPRSESKERSSERRESWSASLRGEEFVKRHQNTSNSHSYQIKLLLSITIIIIIINYY